MLDRFLAGDKTRKESAKLVINSYFFSASLTGAVWEYGRHPTYPVYPRPGTDTAIRR
jgi:hypothetical protein